MKRRSQFMRMRALVLVEAVYLRVEGVTALALMLRVSIVLFLLLLHLGRLSRS